MTTTEFEDEMPQPKILNAPEQIWLVYGEPDEDVQHSDCHEVSWCEDKQFPADVRYVRADTIDTLQSELSRLAAMMDGMNENDLLDWVSDQSVSICDGIGDADSYGAVESSKLNALFTGMKLVPAAPDYRAQAATVRAAALCEPKGE